MADAKIGKGTTSDEQKARPTKDDTQDVLVIDTNDGVDIVLSSGPKRQNKSRVVSHGFKIAGSPKII